jgi:transposase-like protein
MIEEFSTDGVECPKCHYVHYPDEPFFYDESGFEFTCHKCDSTMQVEVYTSTSWTTTIEDEDEE